MFEAEKNLDAIIFMECSGGEPHGDMIMIEVRSFGTPGSLIFVVGASLLFLDTLYQPKLGLADHQKSIWEKNKTIFGRCILTVVTI